MAVACSMARASAACEVSRAKRAKPTARVTTTIPRTATRMRAANVLNSRGIRLLRSCLSTVLAVAQSGDALVGVATSMAEQIAQNHLYRGYRFQRSQAF